MMMTTFGISQELCYCEHALWDSVELKKDFHIWEEGQVCWIQTPFADLSGGNCLYYIGCFANGYFEYSYADASVLGPRTGSGQSFLPIAPMRLIGNDDADEYPAYKNWELALHDLNKDYISIAATYIPTMESEIIHIPKKWIRKYIRSWINEAADNR